MVTDNELCASTVGALIDYYGATHLARILNVRVEDLFNWAQGTGRPPAGVFFRVLHMTDSHS